ncbi:MAG TPA: serine/threonine-protein kinase [Gemmatimonadaceae bacterium]|nr:serine/threonine-protein kinase [Gemmatimonadaceae bacterium]
MSKICPQCGTNYENDQRFCPRDGASLKGKAGADLVGLVIADRYLIVRKLGEGGMGQVYLAEHVRMKRKSAVKVLHAGMVHDPEAIMRFNREAENASQIAHPNVAAIYDFGETADGLCYLAMEFIDGEPLTKVLERAETVGFQRAARIIEQVASALEAAHEIGIVHRDLKPDNIMITRGRDGTDLVKVVDFGIAKAIQADEQNVTKTGLAVGTPEYMSPEQLGGGVLDARTDIYSLGLVAFNLLTGSLPFPTVTSREALVIRLTDRPRKLAEVRPDVIWPPQLQGVIDRALSQELAARYQRVSDLARDLSEAVPEMPDNAAGARSSFGQATVSITPRTRKIAAPTASRRESNGRLLPYLLVVTTVAVVGAGVLWKVNATPDSGGGAKPVASADSVRKDSVQMLARTDSSAVAPTVADSAAPAMATADSSGVAVDSTARPAAESAGPAAPVASALVDSVKPSKPAPPRNLAQLLKAIRSDMAVGASRLEDGEYEGATVRFRSASERLTVLHRRYPDTPAILSLRRELARQLKATADACEAEREVAEERGEEAPECQ